MTNDEQVEERLRRIEIAVFGDEEVNAIGLMKRVNEIEQFVKRLQNIEYLLKGVLIAGGLSTTANLIAVAKLILFP